MARYLGLIAAVLLAACANPPEDTTLAAPAAIDTTSIDADATAVADESTAGEDAIESEPYDPSKDLTLLTCGAHKTIDLVSTPLAEAQAAARLPENVRLIGPGDLVSQDYDTKRMNVFVDEAGTITKIDCG